MGYNFPINAQRQGEAMDKLMVKPAKKLLPMLILDILRRKTDESHHLTQKEIGDILLAEYDMSADRK